MLEAESIQDAVRQDAAAIRVPPHPLTISLFRQEPVAPDAIRGALKVKAPDEVEEQYSAWLQYSGEFRELPQVVSL